MKLPFRSKAEKADKKSRPSSRVRIFVWALFISLVIGAAQITMPIEDIYRGARNLVRARPADGSVVVVSVDDQTFEELGGLSYPRSYDAQVIDKLFAMGAKRIYFDRTFSKPTNPTDDQALIAALDRHPGKVAMIYIRSSGTSVESGTHIRRPAPIFRNHVLERNADALVTPFWLSMLLNTHAVDNGKTIPAIFVDIAGRNVGDAQTVRPDWSIQYSSVPTVSMLTVLKGKVDASAIQGKDVLIGDTGMVARDYVQVLGQGWFPGVYAQAIAAQTLKEGQPREYRFYLPLLLAAIFSALLLRARSRKAFGLIAVSVICVGSALPFVLDNFLIDVDHIPAFVMFGIVGFRALSLRGVTEARLQNADTLLPNVSALREVKSAVEGPILAMRIRNYAAVCASFAEPVEGDLVMEIARRLSVASQMPTFYQAEDVLYWIGPTLPPEELQGHVAGLARLIESHFRIRGRALDIHVAFGIDADVSRPVVNRIGRALLAADNAAANHKLLEFSGSSDDKDTAWELSLMSELDAAIDAGDIWVAYQPQFDLKTDRICGAEALVRWQHPVRGAISPEAFILPAESHNRIQRLTFHVLEAATRAMRPILADAPDFRLSVNVSAPLLELPQLPAQIIDILISTGFPASNLTLEVTESAPFRESDSIRSNLAGIAAMGIDLSIDDYGTGNATLEYLRSVPCQEIKIDRRFVTNLTTNKGDMLLVESTIELAHGLDRRVIAEGIEDPETLELLRLIGCDIAQGYYLARPLKQDGLFDLVQRGADQRAA